MTRRHRITFVMAMLAATALMTPALANPPRSDVLAGVESIKSKSAVSVMAEPSLSDGRLVLRVAAMNRTGEPLEFGPENLTLTTADGKPVEWIPIERLINDVKAAHGIRVDNTPSTELPTTYSSPTMPTNQAGEVDVSGYTGSMGVAGSEFNSRRAADEGPRKKIDADKLAQAEQQIAGLRAGILQESSVAPNEIASGRIVSEQLKFGRKDSRDLRLTIQLDGEEHSFLFTAPPEG